MVVVLSATTIFFSCSTSISYAWGWYDLIPPGSEVFDLKRFMDSAKETAQMLATVQNTLKNLQNRITLHTGVNSDFTSTLQALKGASDMPYGNSLINPSSNYQNTAFWKNWNITDAINDSTYEQTINEGIASCNQETAAILQQVMRHQENRENAIADIQQLETDGVLGEKQKANAIAILDVLTTADNIRSTGAQLMNNVSEQEATYSVDRLDKEKVKAGTFYGYDPYNPSDYDKDHKVTSSSNFGFLKFGE